MDLQRGDVHHQVRRGPQWPCQLCRVNSWIRSNWPQSWPEVDETAFEDPFTTLLLQKRGRVLMTLRTAEDMNPDDKVIPP